MNCSTHNESAAVAFCRTCGKPLCANCTRDVRGVVYCEPCLAARLEAAPVAGFMPTAQTAYIPAVAPGVSSGVPAGVPFRAGSSGPNPAVAGILAGFFPFGVGAVYCSQYAKGLAHLLAFGLLIFGINHAGSWDVLFGIAIAFFYVYQIIDAVRTAKALQEGQPAPDPFGLAQAFSMGDRTEAKNIPLVAIVLIGLGVLFLLHTMNIWEFGVDRLWPLILIGLGAWMFAKQFGVIDGRRMYCACDRCRLRKIMGPAVLVTVGALFLLESFHVVDFDRTWPAILLVIGAVKLLQSNASMAGHSETLAPLPGVVVPPIPPAAPPPTPPAADAQSSSSSGEVSHG
jgi:hypothetical protein